MTVSGYTTVFPIIADPIHHVRTPQTLNALFAKHRYDGIVVPIEVSRSDLGHVVLALRAFRNWGGLIVTVPHKAEMPVFCDRLTARAAAAGAVNVVRRNPDGSLTGELLDGMGFVSGLASAGVDVEGKAVYLAGAGGAASAIAFALAETGVRCLTVVNRSHEKSVDLVARLQARFPAVSFTSQGTPPGHDIIINGTSLGLHDDDPLPLNPETLRPGMVVAEVIMTPEVTPLLAIAKGIGCVPHPGKAMLDGQLAEMFHFLTVCDC